ncbi:ABC transporter substrate-binding protein [uncultured Caulobacter sp.]|jgi:polar amino acid transport system substrate-binding protein|uniref:substrate-binding periplasmic protein n=1 Tax=uncultured Caulobacter sp. TaxID=158749 RepID=UPI0026201801|nr:transporter substrate-binding domain-containing protein [uncultured Caulobacter sp.]
MTRHPDYSRRQAMVLASSGLLLSACGVKGDKVSGALRVGSTATGAPFSFLDIETNSLVGAMIDIAHAVAADAGLSIAVETTAFSALVPSLTAKKIDLVAAGILRTAEREKVVAFSAPVYAYGGAVMVRKDDGRAPQNLAGLKGATVGAQVGTRFVAQLGEAGVTQVKTYDNLADALRDLQGGRLDAVYGDAPLMAYRLRTTPDLPLRLVASFTPPSKEDVCLLVRKEDTALLRKLNASIGRIKSTEIAAIIAKWGLS